MKKVTSMPVLIAIVALFSFCGYLMTRENAYDLLKPKVESVVSHGLIGLSLALYLAALRVVPLKETSSAGESFLRMVKFLGLEVAVLAVVFGIYRGVSLIYWGDHFGNLFYGDSGFAVFSVLGWSAFWLIGVFTLYVVLHVFAQSPRQSVGIEKSE